MNELIHIKIRDNLLDHNLVLTLDSQTNIVFLIMIQSEISVVQHTVTLFDQSRNSRSP